MNEAKVNNVTPESERMEDDAMEELADVVFSVEERDIKAVKSVLCLASPVFRAMLGPNFKESGENRINLPDKTYESFKEFLECFSPNVLRPITEHNVYKVLPLVNEYQVMSLKPQCENVLMSKIGATSRDGSEIYRRLHLAETYRLQGLKEKCCYLASELAVDNMNKLEQDIQISTESQLKIRELALNRFAILKADERCIMIRLLENKEGRVAEALRDEISDIRDDRFSNLSDHRRAMLALRLYYRYFPDNKNLASEAVQDIQQNKAKFSTAEILFYNLLPEQLKCDIERK